MEWKKERRNEIIASGHADPQEICTAASLKEEKERNTAQVENVPDLDQGVDTRSHFENCEKIEKSELSI